MMDMMNNGHGSMMGGMWFFSILFWVLIIAGVLVVVNIVCHRSVFSVPEGYLTIIGCFVGFGCQIGVFRA